MSRKVKASIFISILVISCPYALYVYLHLFSDKKKQVERLQNIASLGHIILKYSLENNGQLPSSFVELYPKYINNENMDILWAPNHRHVKEKTIDMYSFAATLDRDAVYTLARPEVRSHGVLAFEKPSTWNEDSERWPYGFRAVLFSDFHSSFVSAYDMQELRLPYNH